MNKLERVKEIIEDLKECLDGNGVPNVHYITNRLMDLDKVVNTINYTQCCMGEAEKLLCEDCNGVVDKLDDWCKHCGEVL